MRKGGPDFVADKGPVPLQDLLWGLNQHKKFNSFLSYLICCKGLNIVRSMYANTKKMPQATLFFLYLTHEISIIKLQEQNQATSKCNKFLFFFNLLQFSSLQHLYETYYFNFHVYYNSTYILFYLLMWAALYPI